MHPTCTTLTIALHRQGPTVTVELSHQDPNNDAATVPVRGEVDLDLPALLERELDPQAYGEALASQLFATDAVKARFLEVDKASQMADQLLRISLRIDPSAQELQALRWELLRHPATGVALATTERVWFSRFMVSTDWRPVRLRAYTELHAVVAVAAPPAAALQALRLAPVALEKEVGRARAALAGVKVTVLGGPDAPCTLEALVAHAREADILYLVGHGTFHARTGMPTLFLQDATGGVARVAGGELAARLGDLPRGPRLVVLASCESAGDGDHVDPDKSGTVTSTLAARLADAGVPAVVAMQGKVSMDTVARMMPAFFAELLRDGQIDRALAVARGVVRARPDHWMPVLFLRLQSGRIWYTPGFGRDKNDEVWRKLVTPVQQGKVVPLLGPGLLEHICGTSFTVARHMAEKINFPLAPYEWDDLPRVTQFLAVKESRENMVARYKAQLVDDMLGMHRDWLGEAARRGGKLGALQSHAAQHARDTEPDEPYRRIAELRAKVYVTTNFDGVLISGLKAASRAPVQALTSWRHPNKAVVRDRPLPEPTVDAPLVFHALGAFGTDDSLVLTEDDYFNYLITASSEQRMPDVVAGALTSSSLLFLGFKLTDWSFRVLFRLIMGLPSSEDVKKHCHVAVQVDPDLHTMADVEGAKAYLARYYREEARIDIYWGTPREFLAQLHDELARAAPVEVHAEDEPVDPDFAY